MWRDCREGLMALVKLLNDSGLVLEEGEEKRTPDEFSEAHEVAAYMAQMEEEGKTVEMPQPKVQGMSDDEDDDTGPQPVMGNLGNFMDQLAQAFFKSMQNLSPDSSDYIERLKDEDELLKAATVVQEYYTKIEKSAAVARMAALQVEHLYYKHESVEIAKAKAAGLEPPNPKNVIHELALKVYRDADDDRTKTRTMLCQIYHHALHDRFYVARDMLFMSRQQENIQYEDISTQIMFNRMMVQLGLAAFRLGKVQEAHDCLTEIAGSSRGDPTWRTKELLAQGITTRGNRPGDAENEKQERRRQMPYHMHIDLDFIEAAHMTAAMLLEVPAIAAAGKSVAGRPVISKTFMRYLEHYEKSWHGPPESIRETVLFTAALVARGEWEKTADLLTGMAPWRLVLGGAEAISGFKELLRTNVKEAALRTYLYTYGAQYDSLSLVQLSTMFGLDENRSHSIISRMLHEEEVHAAWDQPTKSIVMNRMEPSHLQELALAYADKCALLIDANEKILDAGRGKNQGGGGGGGGGEGGGAGRGGGGRGGDRDNRPPRKGFGGDRIGGRQGGFLDPSRDWKPRRG
jgi:translation initiation factor 3 subunit C